MTFDPTSVDVTCVTLLKDHCVQDPWKYIKVCGYSDPLCKNLNQRSLTPRWPLTPHLQLRSHVWLYPIIIVSKSHGNTSMYVDRVINFANYHIHSTYYVLHTTYYKQNEWSHSLFLNTVQSIQKCYISLYSTCTFINFDTACTPSASLVKKKRKGKKNELTS